MAAVQLVQSKIALSVDVTSAFGVSGMTLWAWGRDYSARGVAGLLRIRSGPKGRSKLTDTVRARIVELNASGLSLLAIAAQTAVSTATVRVALGRVASATQTTAEPFADAEPFIDADADVADDSADDGDGEVVGLVVLAAPAARTAERAAARSGDLTEAPVVITEGAQLLLAGLLLASPALEMTGLMQVAEQTFGPMRKGFYGLRVTLLMTLFMALLREPRAEGATRLRPADLGRILGLDRAPEVKTLRRKIAELAEHNRGAELQAGLGRHHVLARPDAVGFLYPDGRVRVYSGTRQLLKTHIARMRIAGPATEETWVGDADGDPVMVITAVPRSR